MKLALVLLFVTLATAQFDYRSIIGSDFTSKFSPKTSHQYNQNLAIAYYILFITIFIYFLFRILYIEPQRSSQKNRDLSLAHVTYITKISPKLNLEKLYTAEEDILKEHYVNSVQHNSSNKNSMESVKITMSLDDKNNNVIHKIMKNGSIITNRCRDGIDYRFAIEELLILMNSIHCFVDIEEIDSDIILNHIVHNVKIHYLYKFNIGYALNRNRVVSQLSKSESWMVRNNVKNYRSNDKKSTIYFHFNTVSKSKVKINYNGDVYISLTAFNSHPDQSIADTMYWFVKKNF